MNLNVKNFLNLVSSVSISANDIRWKITNDDIDFFNECLKILLEYKINTVLDISCGSGKFVNICNNNGIHAYGVDPIPNNNENIYLGTFSSIINSQDSLNEYEFDCICVHNTLHGKYHNLQELDLLFKFFKKHTKYLIISDPIIDNKFIQDLELMHVFQGSHSNRSVIHKFYKILSS